MKRLLLFVFILLLLVPSAIAEIPNIDDLSNEQLNELFNKIQIKLVGEKLVEGVEIPNGVYIVGEEIPAGNYLISLGDREKGCVHIVVYNKDEEVVDKNALEGYTILARLERYEYKVHLEDGQKLQLEGLDGFIPVTSGPILIKAFSF